MDRIDQQILDLLKENARLSATEIGQRVGRSRAAVSARIDAMLDDGTLGGFTTRTPRAPLCVLFEIRFDQHGLCDSMVAHFRARYALERAWSVTGESDLFICAPATSTGQIHEMRNHLAAHGHTLRLITHTVMKTYD